MSNSEVGDFLFVLDADMTPARSPRALMEGQSDAWAFNLYDLWDARLYRDDAYWQGHNAPRVWMIRRPATSDWVWPDRGIHCGHFPSNLTFGHSVGFAPRDHSLLHYAYSTPELRLAKHKEYMRVSDSLNAHEYKHAATIVDSAPRIFPLPFTPEITLELEVYDRQAA